MNNQWEKISNKVEPQKEDLHVELEKKNQEIAELRLRVEGLEKDNERLKIEKRALEFDQLTKLECRRNYYMTLNKLVGEKIGEKNIAELLDQENVEVDKLQNLDEVDLSISVADVGYLSKYNEDPKITKQYGGGYGGGDEVLKNISEVIQKVDEEKEFEIEPMLDENTKGYRVGGDELTMIHFLKQNETQEVIEKFKTKSSQIIIKGADLVPSVDCGTAHFREGIESFMQTIGKEERREMTMKVKIAKISDTLTTIASVRAKIAKNFRSILTMVNWVRNGELKKLKNNFTYFQKGGLRMDKSEIYSLAKMSGNENELKEKIKDVITQKLEVKEIEEDKTEEVDTVDKV